MRTEGAVGRGEHDAPRRRTTTPKHIDKDRAKRNRRNMTQALHARRACQVRMQRRRRIQRLSELTLSVAVSQVRLACVAEGCLTHRRRMWVSQRVSSHTRASSTSFAHKLPRLPSVVGGCITERAAGGGRRRSRCCRSSPRLPCPRLSGLHEPVLVIMNITDRASQHVPPRPACPARRPMATGSSTHCSGPEREA